MPVPTGNQKTADVAGSVAKAITFVVIIGGFLLVIAMFAFIR